MHFDIIATARAAHQVSHQQALAEGLNNLGIPGKILFSHQRPTSQFVACWGWRRGKELRDQGHEVLVMERGYLADRFQYTSLAWNGLNGHGKFPEYPDDGGARFQSLNLEVKPWKTSGKYILIMGQVPTDASLQGRDLLPWYISAAQRAAQFYRLPVKFRQHPDLTKKGILQQVPGTVHSSNSLAEDLADARLCICFNSNSAVDAVLAGVPVIVGDKGTMAWEMASTAIRRPRTPDRTAWLHRLAHTQWKLEEIRAGVPLPFLLDVIKS